MGFCCSWSQLELESGPEDSAVGSKRDCWDGNLGKVRVYDAFAFDEQNVKPIFLDVQPICVYAIFQVGHVAEMLACLALSTRAASDVVAFSVLLPRQHKVHTCSGPSHGVQDTNGWLVICDFESRIAQMGHRAVSRWLFPCFGPRFGCS